jgi:DNA-binding CsgD family transcriptional regulator/tetratricopeptide (TPR) repeat protein
VRAAAQYERALRNAHHAGKPLLAALQEGVADEYALLDRWEEAEQARRAALALRRELGDTESVGKNLGSLSSTLWRLCRGEEAEQAAEEAVQVLAALPPGEALAWAYAGLACAYLTMGGPEEAALASLGKALDIAGQRGYVNVTCFALGVEGAGLIEAGRDGMPPLEESFRIARGAGVPGGVGEAYCRMVEACAKLHRFAELERYYAEGLAYCEGRELAVFSKCMNGWRARMLVFLGRWEEATQLCARNLSSPGISPVNQLNPLCVLGTIAGRRGEDGAWELLDRALAFAEGTTEPAWIALARAARAELSWLDGRLGLAAAEARAGYDVALGHVDPWALGSLAIWLARLGAPPHPPSRLPEPYALEIAGDHGAAAAVWEWIGRPYDAAPARAWSSDEAGLREALAGLEELGASVAAVAVRRRMRELGMKAIPRGPRTATRVAPAGLTAREQEVLALLADGLTDREISQKLFISERTVHHHVSAVLAKTGAASRTAAAREAARLGIAPAN